MSELARLGDVLPEAAAVVELASRARGMHASGSEDLSCMHAHAAPDFGELVRPLGLKGPNRDRCFAAFTENPAGFAACVADALRRGHNPAAFLVHLVDAGDHRVDPPTRRCDHPACRGRARCLQEDDR